MKKQLPLLISLIFNCLIAIGQTNQGPAAESSDKGIQAIGRYHLGHVELRWAPADYGTWQRGNQQGFIVERYEADGMKLLTPQPIRPLSLEEWATKTDTNNVWNKAAAQLLYGKMKGIPAKPTLAQVKEIAQIQSYQLANALIAADLSAETAKGMALAFSDPDAKPGKTYGYRIRLAEARIGAPDTARVFVDTREVWKVPQVQGLRAENGEHSVMLKWDKQLSEAYFTAFWVEKSTDGGKNFARLNKEALFVSGFAKDGAENFFTDSLEANYRPAQYRVVGITPFGDLGLPSAAVKGMGRDLTPPGGAEKVKAISHAANKITITWDAVVDPTDLAGWYVQRGNDAAGIFTNVNAKPLAPATRQFTDTEPFAFQNNYYRVVAVDTAGNEGVSMNAFCFIIDSIAPAQPIGLVGTVDSTGVAYLAWDLGTEQDLRGYRVYASHGPNREFKQLTSEPLFQNYFTDTLTLRTLSEKIYYRVAAVDYRWNHSAYSELLELKKPDIIAPVAPIFKQYSVNGDTVHLQWANSTSQDVVSQILWKQENGAEWKPVATFKRPFPNQYTDQLKPDTPTSYALEALDDDQLSSGKSKDLTVAASAQRPRIQGFMASIDKQAASARLSWKYATQDCRFVVFRAQGGEALAPFKSVGGDEMTFADLLRDQGNYRYSVKAVFADGSESEQSEPITLQF